MHGLFLPVSPQLAPSRGTMKCWVWAGWPGSRPCFGGEGKEEYLAHHEHADGNGTSQRNVGRVTEWQQAAFMVCPYAQGMQFKQQTVFSFFPAVGVGEKVFCQTYGESGVIVLSVWFIWCETKFWYPRVPKPLWSCQLGQLLSPWFPRCLGRFTCGLTVAGSGPSTCTDPAVAVATMHSLHPHLYVSAPIALHQKGVCSAACWWRAVREQFPWPYCTPKSCFISPANSHQSQSIWTPICAPLREGSFVHCLYFCSLWGSPPAKRSMVFRKRAHLPKSMAFSLSQIRCLN